MPIVDPQTQQIIETARQRGAVIVLATGVFDILHQEHKNFLHKAKELAGENGVLIVGIESDKRTHEMKGEGRPVNSQDVRRQNLLALRVPDAVFILPDTFSRPADHEQLIQEIQPQFLAVSSHTAHLDKKKMLLEKYGGELRVVHQHNPAISTTKILEAQEEKQIQVQSQVRNKR